MGILHSLYGSRCGSILAVNPQSPAVIRPDGNQHGSGFIEIESCIGIISSLAGGDGRDVVHGSALHELSTQRTVHIDIISHHLDRVGVRLHHTLPHYPDCIDGIQVDGHPGWMYVGIVFTSECGSRIYHIPSVHIKPTCTSGLFREAASGQCLCPASRLVEAGPAYSLKPPEHLFQSRSVCHSPCHNYRNHCHNLPHCLVLGRHPAVPTRNRFRLQP